MRGWLLLLCVCSVNALGLRATFDAPNEQAAMMLSTLPSIFSTQLRDRQVPGMGSIFPFQTHSNEHSDSFDFGTTFAPLQWDAKHKKFYPPVPEHSALPRTMSLKRFFQNTQLPLSGTFLPLDVKHARMYSLFNPMLHPFAFPRVANVADFAKNFGTNPNNYARM